MTTLSQTQLRRYSLHQHFLKDLNQHIPYKAISSSGIPCISTSWISTFLQGHFCPMTLFLPKNQLPTWFRSLDPMWTGAAVNWWQFTQALCSGKDSKPLRSFSRSRSVHLGQLLPQSSTRPFNATNPTAIHYPLEIPSSSCQCNGVGRCFRASLG